MIIKRFVKNILLSLSEINFFIPSRWWSYVQKIDLINRYLMEIRLKIACN